MAETWLVISIILIIVECATINLVSIWFAVGAILASVTAIFTDQTLIQVAVFVLGSIVSFVALKPLAKRLVNTKVERTNLDRIINKINLVTKCITKLKPNKIKVDKKRWAAISDKKIEKDSKVEILAIEGVKLRVKEVKEEE